MRRWILALLLVAVSANAADPVKFSGSARIRSESWSFFEANGFDDRYTYLAVLLRASLAQQLNPSLDWQVELAAPALLGLPDHAIAPAPRGQLGLGATYFAANGDENAVGLFPKQAFVRWKSGTHALRAGRFEFNEGSEVAPKNATLAALKNARVAQRLIGAFGFSHVGRSADGVHYVFNRDALNVNAALFRPTQGAFNVEGLGEVDDVGLGYASLNYSRPNADERIFLITYSDRRDLVKTDNRPASVRAQDFGDIEIATIGGHYLALFGKTDVLVWLALQGGDWGALEHHAGALALEAGYHFDGPRAAAVRGGIFRSSGDDDATDDEHGTFFQILPTPRPYARFPFYNAMNSTDTFVQFSFKPMAKLTVATELHRLRLSEEADLWYSGGGAFEDKSFGFAGRTSNGNDELARVVDLSVDYALNPKTSLTGYIGLAKGGEVVDAIFDDDGGALVYFEVIRRF